MNKKRLILEQLDRNLSQLETMKNFSVPQDGWIYSIRKGINMSLRQLGERLSITPQSVREMEEREKKGTVSLNVLKEVADALNMKFVYAFIPEESLETMVETRAEKLAETIVRRTSIHMSLENQRNTDERLKKAINEKKIEIADEMPRYLWDQI
jgi:predicted DNA-binding mobile mystery protein A